MLVVLYYFCKILFYSIFCVCESVAVPHALVVLLQVVGLRAGPAAVRARLPVSGQGKHAVSSTTRRSRRRRRRQGAPPGLEPAPLRPRRAAAGRVGGHRVGRIGFKARPLHAAGHRGRPPSWSSPRRPRRRRPPSPPPRLCVARARRINSTRPQPLAVCRACRRRGAALHLLVEGGLLVVHDGGGPPREAGARPHATSRGRQRRTAARLDATSRHRVHPFLPPSTSATGSRR